MELFEAQGEKRRERQAPLADRMRPRTLEEFVGQTHLTAPGHFLHTLFKTEKLPSLILWGPPGCGKTTLARILSQSKKAHLMSFSAVLSGVKEIREVIDEAKNQFRLYGRATLLFVDEILRFNKAQQDAFLPHIENGTITLIGATTENPSFEVISALLSRCKVLTFHPLSEEEIQSLLRRAVEDPERGLGRIKIEISKEALDHLSLWAHGDARVALNALEVAVSAASKKVGTVKIGIQQAEEAVQQPNLLYDKKGEEHYNVISAFIKSMRGSDPDATIYYLARMYEAGEDPLFIARRMVIFASEDVGNADPQALQVAVAGMQAYDFVGQAEGWIPLAQTATYLALAPKSNASYAAYKEAKKDVTEKGALPTPLKLRNPVTTLMKEIGYGKGYQYPHDHSEHYVEENYLPEALADRRYYPLSEQGYEKTMAERLTKLRQKGRS
ncbi:MAG: replication-associated recombination protein A [Deltaproteobacteria bacterium]|nr:replication-associated recombination protein A [Deltaproteobacteria bacterium]